MNILTRRRFLLTCGVTAGVALAAGATEVTVSQLLDRAHSDPLPHGAGILVLVTLYGGNDGLSTVIPYADPAYRAIRPDLAYPAEQVLHLDGATGLNPAMTGLKKEWDAGRLAIVRGVGYPQPDHSHFRSMAIWQTASPATPVPTGWLGRWLDAGPDDPVRAVSIGPVLPPLLAGATTAGATLPLGPLTLPEGTLRRGIALMGSTYAGEPTLLRAAAHSGTDLLTVGTVLGPALSHLTTSTPAAAGEATQSPDRTTSALARQLDVVAACITAGVPTRVYSVSLGGFDTHSDEKGTQSALLGELDRALTSFTDAMAGDPHGRDVVTVVYSEFGRRVAANASSGTDHGTAGPVLVLGPRVRGGFVGQEPSLTDLDAGDLRSAIDFRSVYATALSDVLGAEPDRILNGTFAPLPLFS